MFHFFRKKGQRIIASLLTGAMLLSTMPTYSLAASTGSSASGTSTVSTTAETTGGETTDEAIRQQILTLLEALDIENYTEEDLDLLASGELTLEELTGWSSDDLTACILESGVGLSEQQLIALENGTSDVLSVLLDSQVRLIVELEGAPVVQQAVQVFSDTGVMSADARSAQVTIQSQQAAVESAIARTVTDGADVDVVYHYTLLTNALAVEATMDQMDEIAQISGVSNVYVDPVYQAIPTDADSGTVESTSEYTVYQSGTSTAYSGAGQVIAVIDTGITTTHEAFATAPDTQSLTLTSMQNLDLSQLNAYTLLGSEDANTFAESVYLSGKIPFRFNYADESTYVGHDKDSQSDHGTHVAGIAAGYTVNAEGVVTFSGTAPQAQLVVMKVFGANRAGQWSDILAALEDCYVLGVDVINMSLGSVSGFSDFADSYTGDTSNTNTVFSNLESAGIVVCCAAGNDYTSAYGNSFGNNLSLASDPDNSILSKPGSLTSTLAVASAASETYYGYSVQVTTGDGETHKFAYTNNYTAESRNILKFKGETKGIVVLESANGTLLTGTATDFDTYCSNDEIKGKIVVVKRGQTFTTTAALAEKYGAIGLIVYDHSEGSLSTMAENTEVSIPAIFISKADGAILCDYYNSDKENASITISDTTEKITNVDAGSISDFSSQGVTNDLKLKPEITGLGGNVYSATGDGSYGLKSGTSMATPYTAGVAATLKEALEARYGEDAKQQVTKELITDLLMSTAVPLTQSDNGGTLYSPRRQGAGLVNLANAVNTPAYLVTDDGLSKLELGDKDNSGAFGADGKTLTLQFNVQRVNNASGALNYSIDVAALTEQILKDQNIDYTTSYYNRETGSYEVITVTEDFMSGKAYQLSPTVTVTGDGVTASDGGYTLTMAEGTSTVELTVTVQLSDADISYLEQYKNGIYVDGFVFLNSLDEGGVDLSIPFLSFYGNWVTIPVFDEGTWADELLVNPTVDAAVASGTDLTTAIAETAPISAFSTSTIGTYYKFWGYLHGLGTSAIYDDADDWYGSMVDQLVQYTDYTEADALQYSQDYNVINQYPKTQSYFNNYSSITHNALSTTRALDTLSQQVWYFPDWTGTQTELYDTFMSLSTQAEREAWLQANATLAYTHTSENLRKSYYYSSSTGVISTGYFTNEDTMDWFAAIYPTDENGQSYCTWSSDKTSDNYPNNVTWLPDNAQCLVVLTALPDYSGLDATDESIAQAKYQNTIAAPVKVDNSAADLEDLSLDYEQDEDGTEHLYYSVKVKDNNPVEAVSLYIHGDYKGSTQSAVIDIPVPYGTKCQDKDGYVSVCVDLMGDGASADFAPYSLQNWGQINYIATSVEDLAQNVYITYQGAGVMKDGSRTDYLTIRPYANISIVTNTKVLSQSRSLQMSATGTADTADYASLYPTNASDWTDEIRYVSLNPEIATVTSDGKVTAVYTQDTETRTVTIRAYSASFPNVYADFTLTVTPYLLQKQVDEADAETGLRYSGGDVTETITIEKDVIIDMGGATITSIAGNPAFNIDNGAKVTLRNATIVADSAEYADDTELLAAFLGDAPSAIRVLNGDLTLEQCVVYGSQVTVDGETLYTGSAVDLLDGSTLTVKKSELHGMYAINNAVEGYVAGGLITIDDGTFFGDAAAIKNYVTGETVTYSEGTSAYDTDAYFTDALTESAVSNDFTLAADSTSASWGGVTFTPDDFLNDWTAVGCSMSKNADGSVRVTLSDTTAYIYCNLPADKQFVGTGSATYRFSTRANNGTDGNTTQKRINIYWEENGSVCAYNWINATKGMGQSSLQEYGDSISNADNSSWNGQTIKYLRIDFNPPYGSWSGTGYLDIGYFTICPTAWASYGVGSTTVNASTTILTAVKDAAAGVSTVGSKVYITNDESNLVSDALTKAPASFYSRFGYRWVPTSVTLADNTEVPLTPDENGSYFENPDNQKYTVNFTLQSVLTAEEKERLTTACADTATASAFLTDFVTNRLGNALGISELGQWADEINDMLDYLQDALIARDAMHWDTPKTSSNYSNDVSDGYYTKAVNPDLPTDLYFLGSPAYGATYYQNIYSGKSPSWGAPIYGAFNGSSTTNSLYEYCADRITNEKNAKEKFLTPALTNYQNTVDGIKSCNSLSEQLTWLQKNANTILNSAYNVVGVVKYNNATNSYGSSVSYSGKDACYYDNIMYSGVPDYLYKYAITEADVEATYGTDYNPGKNWVGEKVENYNPFEDETLLEYLVKYGVKQAGEKLESKFDPTEYLAATGKFLTWASSTSTTLAKLTKAINGTPVSTVLSSTAKTSEAYWSAVSDAENVSNVLSSKITEDGGLTYLSTLGSGSGTSLAEFPFTVSFKIGSSTVATAKYQAGSVIADPMADDTDPIYTYRWYYDEALTQPVTFDENLTMPMSNTVFYGAATSKLDEDIAKVEAGGTLTLEQDYSNLSFTTYITQDLTLVTNGHSIDTAGTSVPVFTVQPGVTLTLKDSSMQRMIRVEEGATLVLDNSSLLSASYAYAVSGSGTVKFGSGSAAAGITAAVESTVTIDEATQPLGYLDNMDGAYFANQLTTAEKDFLQSLKGDSLYDENILFYADTNISDTLYGLDNGTSLTVYGTPATDSGFAATANTANDANVTSTENGYTATLGTVTTDSATVDVAYTVSGNQWSAQFGSFAADLGLTLSATAKQQLADWDASQANAQEQLTIMLEAIETYEGNSYVQAFVSDDVASMKAYANAIQAELETYSKVTGDAEKLIAYYALVKKTDFEVPGYYTGTFAGAFADLATQIDSFNTLIQLYASMLNVSVDSGGKIPAAGSAIAKCSSAISSCANAPLLDITLDQVKKLMAVDTTTTTHGITDSGSIAVHVEKTFTLYPLTILNDSENGDRYGAVRYYQAGTDLAKALADVSRKGYSVTWLDEMGQSYTDAWPMPAMPAKAMTVIAAWIPIYTVTWVNSDDQPVGTAKADSGTNLNTLTAPDGPEKTSDKAGYSYEFAGWSMTDGAITGNLKITPEYKLVYSGGSGTSSGDGQSSTEPVSSTAENTLPEDLDELANDEEIKEVSIKAEVKQTVDEEAKSVTVTTTFDKEAIGQIAQQLKTAQEADQNAVVKLVVHAVEKSDPQQNEKLNEKQQEALSKDTDAVIFDLSLTVGDQKVTFSEEKEDGVTTGAATISLPFNGDAEGKKVYYVDDDGRKHDMNAKYENGFFTFETNHFSLYAITEEAEDAAVAYKVYHRLQLLTDLTQFNMPNLSYRETLYAVANTQVTPAVWEIEGFTAPKTQTVTVGKDGKTVVYYNYTRNSYTVTYEIDGKVYKTETYLYGETVTPLEVDEKEGNTFSGWTWSTATGAAPDTMPATDLTVTGKFSVDEHTITYEINGVEVYKQSGDYGTAITMPRLYSGNTQIKWEQEITTIPAKDTIVNVTVDLSGKEKTFDDESTRTSPTDAFVFTLLTQDEVILYAPDFTTTGGYTWKATTISAAGEEYTAQNGPVTIEGNYPTLASTVTYETTILEVNASDENLMKKLTTMAEIHQTLMKDADSMLAFLYDQNFKSVIYEQVDKERMNQFMADVATLKNMMSCFNSDSTATNEEKLAQLFEQYSQYKTFLDEIWDVMDKINTKLENEETRNHAKISYPDQLNTFDAVYPRVKGIINRISEAAPSDADRDSYHNYTVKVQGMQGTVDFKVYTELATIQTIDAQSFTVTCTQACVVAYTTDDGETYTRLNATTTETENCYSFTLPEEVIDAQIVVALKGDLDLDGEVQTDDAQQILRYAVKGRELTALEQTVANVNGDSKVNSSDALQILRLVAGVTKFEWDVEDVKDVVDVTEGSEETV